MSTKTKKDLGSEIRDLAWKKIWVLKKHPESAKLLSDNLSIPGSGFFGQKGG
jgi:hypothetical protein